MKIIVCIKCVPDDESIRIAADGSIDLSEAKWHIGQYDLNAVEAARQLAESLETAELIAITAGGSVVEEGRRRKDMLSRGFSKLYCVKGDDLQTASADSFYTAGVLASAIRKIGGVDLALFGEGSGDMYSQQTGAMTGALLGWNTLNAITGIELDGNELIVERSLEDKTETLRLSLPAALSVTADINLPRLPSVKETLAAGKKPFEIWEIGSVAENARHGSDTDSVKAPQRVGRKREVYEALNDDSVAAIAGVLKKFM